jgi:poly-gamma-glutamate synthase PgsB/CapB
VTSPGKAWERWLGFEKNGHLAATAGLPEFLAYLQERAADPSFFITPFTNELWHLGAFLGFFGLYVMGKQTRRQISIRSWRRRMPLCIGGWGSRGKSGTERLKAALFHGLGYRVFSKTTGTLPMFVSSIPGLDPVEVPIYRPYDKATIWEQTDMLRQAAGLDAQVFLWECMALKPRYVSIMTDDWMTDDYSTVTNTYPDHEDIQGPTGYDVAHSISTFIPKGSHLITSELQAAPVLAERCRKIGTDISVLPHATWHLISKEFLDRYPYLEHPANIGLVMELGAGLGIPNDVALAVMADFLLADIGALRQYPAIEVESAKLDFTNIMSANERAGFISSFERLGLDQWKDEERLETRVVLYVNNREDRPARSHVFAKVVVEDTPVHAVVVVGTATHEFAALVELYLEEYLSRYRVPVSRDDKGMIQWLETLFHPVRRRPHEAELWPLAMSRWLRVPSNKLETLLGPVFDKLVAQASQHRGVWNNEAIDRLAHSSQDAIEKAVDELVDLSKSADLRSRYSGAISEELSTCAILAGFYRNPPNSPSAADRPEEVTSLVKTLTLRHLLIIDDPSMPGPELMRRCLAKTVPGAMHHFVGMQNIKGPGLTFVNLWAAIETMVHRCETLLAGGEQERGFVLEWLVGLKRLSSYEAMIARDALLRKGGDGLKDLSLEEKAVFERLVGVINQAAAGQRAVVMTGKKKLLPMVLGALDNVIDYRDSLSRRTAADATLRLLALGLISHPEAVVRLDKIYDRQKKGPLSARMLARD